MVEGVGIWENLQAEVLLPDPSLAVGLPSHRDESFPQVDTGSQEVHQEERIHTGVPGSIKRGSDNDTVRADQATCQLEWRAGPENDTGARRKAAAAGTAR